MGKLLLAVRLAVRDLRRRPGQAALLLVALTASTTTLALALALHGVAANPYERTRAATAGPDIVAQFNTSAGQARRQSAALARARGVTGHSGPYPVAGAVLRAHGVTALAEAEGRGEAPASVDQPQLTSGGWVHRGAAVVERGFAAALGVSVGDVITLDGRPFRVAGVAVTAAVPTYPFACRVGCDVNMTTPPGLRAGPVPGLVWVTLADARSLAASAREQPTYLTNLKLADPAAAAAFADAHRANLITWQAIRAADSLLVVDAQQVLVTGSLLLGLLAVASVAVLAGGRMSEQTQRVGMLKAVGSSPGLVAAVLLAENMALALTAAAAGLALGWLAAPLLTSPGAGLVGSAGAPSLTASTVGLVVAVALAVALTATLMPAVRASRTSTVRALADAARPARRRAMLTAVSARLPVPLLLGVRLGARRPRRLLLSAASIAITVTGIVAVLAFQATVAKKGLGASGEPVDPVAVRDGDVLLVISVALVTLASINAVVSSWATVLEVRRATALARALGTTPQQVSAGLSVAQLLPALMGAAVGIPAGIGLFRAANHAGLLTIPPAWSLAEVVAGTLLAVWVLTMIPARMGARRPVTVILRSETA